MSHQFMERHPAIRNSRTCLQAKGDKHRRLLMEVMVEKEKMKLKNDKDEKSELESEKMKKKRESRKLGRGLCCQHRPKWMNIILCI